VEEGKRANLEKLMRDLEVGDEVDVGVGGERHGHGDGQGQGGAVKEKEGGKGMVGKRVGFRSDVVGMEEDEEDEHEEGDEGEGEFDVDFRFQEGRGRSVEEEASFHRFLKSQK
jgi:hypothetical protein